ncbi:MAG: TAXI family TRAP transporter solute-binding subunit [Fimbriiglobus sp.]
MPDPISERAYAGAESFLGRAMKFYSRNHVSFLLGLIGLSLLLSSLWLYQSLSKRKVILYTGGVDSDSYNRGLQLQKHFETHRPNWFVKYDVEVRQSVGLPENRMHVANAKPGTIILGFDQDGFAPPRNVRTLFPLTDVTLHILIKQPTTTPLGVGPFLPPIETLKQFIDWRRDQPGNPRLRFFLGPKGSGTRLIAETVLRHYDLKLTEVDSAEQYSWTSAYEALRANQLDVVFDSGEVGSPFIVDKARENHFRLISLDHVEGIVQGQQSLVRKEILPGAYVVNDQFSNQKTQTVSTQRIIICPESLSDFDAYYLTAGIQETFRDVVPVGKWDKSPVPKGSELIVPLHPGANQVREKSSEPMVILQNLFTSNLQWIITIVGGFVSWRISRKSKNRLPVVAIQHTESTYPQGAKIGPIKFGVADAETDPEKLKVSWSSNNEQLFPKSCGTLLHDRHSCSLELVPTAGQSGKATITIVVTDEQGGKVENQFVLNVVPTEELTKPSDDPTPSDRDTKRELSVSLPRPLRDGLTDLDDLLTRLGKTAAPADQKTLRGFRRELDQFKSRVQQLRQTYMATHAETMLDIAQGLGTIELEYEVLKASSKTQRVPNEQPAPEPTNS